MAAQLTWKIERIYSTVSSTTTVIVTGLRSAAGVDLELLTPSRLCLSCSTAAVDAVTIDLPRPCRDGGVRAKWKKKSKELWVTFEDGKALPKVSTLQAAEVLPPPPLQATQVAKKKQQSLSRDFFPRASFLFGDSREFEDLIEATQDWRREMSKTNMLRVAKLIVKGCEKGGREDEIRELGRIFMDKIGIGVECGIRDAFFEETSAHGGDNRDSDEESRRPVIGIVDDAAQRVLEYVCETGMMPDEDNVAMVRENAPLHTLQEGYLDRDVFEKLRREVEGHEALLKEDSEALGEGFDKTKGFIYRFSEKGVHKLRESKWAECLLPFFDEARDEGVNGFVLNVLCVDVEAGDEGGYAVGWHRDATVGFRVGADVAGIRQKIADSVTVIYVSLPVGFGGGELELRHPEKRVLLSAEDRGGMNVEVDASVRPELNLGVKFRGDAEHAVRKMTCSSGVGKRISVVLEQYKVPIGDEPWLVEFELVDPLLFKRQRYGEEVE